MRNKEQCQFHKGGKRHHGPDSFWMHDPEQLFNLLQLEEGDVFADLGCGIASILLRRQRIVGDKGLYILSTGLRIV